MRLILGQAIKLPRPPIPPRGRDLTERHGQSEACQELLLTRIELLRMLSVIDDMGRVFAELPRLVTRDIGDLRDRLRRSINALESNLRSGHCDVISPEAWQLTRVEYEGDVGELWRVLDAYSRGEETRWRTPAGAPYWPK